MTGTDRQFAGSIPILCDRYLGPLIFEPYVADIAARVAAGSPLAVLETAAGTGVVTAGGLAPRRKKSSSTPRDARPMLVQGSSGNDR